MHQVSKEEWAEWKEHPVTSAVLSSLSVRQGVLKDSWAAGVFTADVALNAKAIGEAQGYQNVLDLSREEVNQGNSNE